MQMYLYKLCHNLKPGKACHVPYSTVYAAAQAEYTGFDLLRTIPHNEVMEFINKISKNWNVDIIYFIMENYFRIYKRESNGI